MKIKVEAAVQSANPLPREEQLAATLPGRLERQPVPEIQRVRCATPRPRVYRVVAVAITPNGRRSMLRKGRAI